VRCVAAALPAAVGKAVLVLAVTAPGAVGADLEQLACLTSDPGRPAGCAPIRGFYPDSRFAAELSHNGLTVYVANESGIAVFARDPVSGALRQLDGPVGCVMDIPEPECTPAQDDNFEDAELRNLVVAPDDRHIYAVFDTTNGEDPFILPLIVGYHRDPVTGALSALPAPAGCLSANPEIACGELRGLGGSSRLTMSPDGRQLYASSEEGRTVAVLGRDPSSGTLSPIGCITTRRGGRCTHIAGPFFVGGLSLSRDGRNAYGAASAYCVRRGKRCRPGAVLAFSRDDSTGMLAPLPGRARCVRNGGRGGCRRGRDQFDPIRTVVSPDGRNVYATGSESLTVYRRDPATGALNQLGSHVKLRGVRIPVGLTISPDGTRAYLGSGNGAIDVFRRNAEGRLIERACVTRRRHPGCTRARISPLPFTVPLSPDGRFAYTGGERVVGIFRTGPAARPARG
jgi:hypothetical protein